MMEWKEVKLGKIVKFLNAKRIPLNSKARENKKGKYPYYGASGIVDYLDDYIFDGRYLLISEDGENLKTRKTPISFIAEGKYWVNNHAHILDEKYEGVLDYLKYYFSVLNIKPYLTGAVQPKLNKKTLSIIPIKLPPVHIRLKINHILSTFDEKIEHNQKMNETLEAMAQAIFKSWFVDFDPVHAKARAKTKADLETEAKKLGITPEILELFPSEFEESELGMIPKGWEVKPFSDIAKLDTNSIKPFLYPDKVWKHFSIPAFDSSGYPTLEMGSDIKSNKYVVNKNAILSSKLNPHTPRTWIPNVIEGDLAICSTEFMQFIPHSNISRVYVYLLITSKYFQDGIKSRVTGTTGSRQRAQPKQVAEIKICKPSDELLDLFSKVVQPIIDMQLENVEEIQTLQKTRDTLLPKLLSGELDVSEVKI